MADAPLHTRETLLLRLRDSADDASWAEFAEIYTPLMYAYCQKRELRREDIADIVQEVMRSVSLALKGFDYDPQKGKFKGWLFTSLRHAIGNHFRKAAKRPMTVNETRMVEMIENVPDPRESDDWELDYQRQLLAWAVEKIKPEFSPRIWCAFEQTAIKGRAPDEVADELEMTKGALAVAKHRVTQRLKEKAESVDAERWEGEMLARVQHPRDSGDLL